MIAVDIKNITHTYPLQKGQKTPRTALDHLSLSVEEGKITGFLGPNGGGKTTLFKILSTLLKPTSGDAFIFGKHVLHDERTVRQMIGVVFQSPSIDKKLTVFENCVHHAKLYGLSSETREEKIFGSLKRLRIEDRKNDFVETLSGGLQRRVEIAKALLHTPKLLVMDEPSTGLDPGARFDLWKVLEMLRSSGVTILLTTHLMEEADKCDAIAILNHGKCVSQGTPKELKEKIGGDVITVQTLEPATLAVRIQEKFNLPSKAFENGLHVEKENGHLFIPELIQAFPKEIESVRIGKPTLEDVFLKETGQFFGERFVDTVSASAS